MGFFFGWLFLCILAAIVAKNVGRSGVGYFFLSLFFSPIIGFLILLIVSINSPAHQRTAIHSAGTDSSEDMTKICPKCGNRVSKSLYLCDRCGATVPD